MNTENKITVLGKTFNSEEERRAYFREELRKKLPEIKKMEGFPIGEDDDILNLSDPPYYTACPNPFLPEIIADWTVRRAVSPTVGLTVRPTDDSLHYHNTSPTPHPPARPAPAGARPLLQ